MGFFISDAMAAANSAGAQTDGTVSLIMIAAIFVLFYFMLIRPQSKRAKEHRNMIGQLQKDDEIITTGGVLGKVIGLDDSYIKLSIAENVEIRIQRNAVSMVLPKGTMQAL